MCYGSGCLKEDHMGNCRVMDYEPYRETKFRCPCLLYGNENEVIEYYLDEEEYQEEVEAYQADCSYNWEYISEEEYNEAME